MLPAPEALPALLTAALGGDAAAMRKLVAALLPLVQSRVVRVLWRQRRSGRDMRQEADDLIQDVFAGLFAQNARALRSWDPRRGLSLLNFVGLLAEHEVAAFLRTGRRSSFADHDALDAEAHDAADPGQAIDRLLITRELLVTLLDRLRGELSPRGLHLFSALIVEEVPVDELALTLGMTVDAVYAWRSRLLRRAREILVQLQSGSAGQSTAARGPAGPDDKEVGRERR